MPALPPITLTPCTPSDGPAIARNNIPAFFTVPNWRLIWTRMSPPKSCEYVTSQCELRVGWNLVSGGIKQRHLKAVDATGRVVGYCRWSFPSNIPDSKLEAMWPEAKVAKVSKEEERRLCEAHRSADWEFDHSLDVLDVDQLSAKERLMRGRGYLLLDYLAVHPDCRRQGIALMLVQEGLKQAEKLGFDTFVMACEDGKAVYERAGFVLLEQVVQDDSAWGGEGRYTTHFLEKRLERK
ncbi:acyl-CoA N-acyltransferase [Hyaloscypha variabilis F]|uniref:Acyl-CoA N-acyltransferase n=1 Tax=Hyaloscypha variabilis (strain UAMH 11265 / GT02V1 / F) TaxID=1149755 RepID=A0A2J6RYW3_HYAVF|nr:acyl-CoA N-acyltransferase [Hyaloscypha variabilis F]